MPETVTTPGVRLALFDVDNTLVESSTYRTLLTLAWRRGWRRGRLLAIFLGRLPRLVLRRFGLSRRPQNQAAWAQGVARLLAGATRQEVQGLMRAVLEELQDHMRQQVVEELRTRHKEGYRVVLASNAVAPLVAELASWLGASAYVGTPLEVAGDRYTGRLAGPPCNQERKLQYLQDATRDWGAIDWAGSYAYSDGFPDLPMLMQVGHPVAVSPDPQLLAVARLRGWRVL